MAEQSEPVLCVFAKAPLPGQAKTRLLESWSEAQVTAIATLLIDVTVQRLVTHWPGRLELWVALDKNHAVFDRLRTDFAVPVHAQPGGDLGQRMQAALDARRDHLCEVALTGTDIPHMPAVALAKAYHALRAGHNVFGPAVDGGFWFYGLHQPVGGVFEGVDWTRQDTGQQTLARAATLDLHFQTRLPILQDVDTPADLERLRAEDSYIAAALRAVGL